MAARGRGSDVHQTCKNIQYRKDLRIEELENANEKLRRNLKEQVTAVEARAASKSSKYDDLQSTYAELQDKYQRSRQQVQDCKKWARALKQHADQSYEKYKLYRGKYVKSKQAVREWQEYYEACTRSRAEKSHGHYDLSAEQTAQVDIRSRSPDVKHLEPDGADIAAVHHTIMRPKIFADTTVLRSSSLPRTVLRSRIESEFDNRGSDATECPSSPPLITHELSSDDAPVIVFARSVKRKRSNSERIMPPPTSIKQEHSSPHGHTESLPGIHGRRACNHLTFARQQTSDLDALADKLATPRKPKLRQQIVPNENPRLRSAASRSPVIPETSGLEDVQAEYKNPRPRTVSPPFERAIADDRKTEPSERQALQELGANSISGHVKRSSEPFDKAVDKIHMLSEDGDDRRGNFERLVEDKGGSQQLRLNSLLEMPSPGHQILAKTPRLEAPAQRTVRIALDHDADNNIGETLPAASKNSNMLSSNMESRQGLSTSVSDQKETLSHRQHSPALVQKQLQRLAESECALPCADSKKGPLRSRSTSSLRLEDFRINPNYMGSEFAWADTLRGRDQRRCLPNCTKPECCGGAFMNFAEIVVPSRSDHTDAQVLKAYLGPGWAELIGAHSKEKGAQILMQARAACLANQFGKHKQAFERRSTPPGFWRIDMPSTQEAEQDHAKARDMVREKIEERQREAMREGGRWVFRDES
nr:hypothetical protein CFP56_71234 [Quercus suber]